MDMVIPCLNIIFKNNHVLKRVVIIKTTEYRIIPNTNNRYYATSDGHIYDTKFNKFIAENYTQRGWLQCHIWMNDVRITINVHRLIMYAFYGICSLTVNHKDGNKRNNSIDNLEYATCQEQNLHRSNVLKVGNRKKVICLENNKVYETIKEACEDLNIKYTNSHISEICKHKYGFKSSHGYHFEYYIERVEDIEKVS